MSQPKRAATKGRRPATGKAEGGAGSRKGSGGTKKPPTAPKRTLTAKRAPRTTSEAARKRAERERLRALLPPSDPHYEALWDEGAARAYAERNADPIRIAVRSVHKKRITAIAARTGLDRQAILNRAIAAGWEKLHMSGTELSAAASRIRKQTSPAAGTVSLYPTAETLRIFRRADHPQAKAILLQTGLNGWA